MNYIYDIHLNFNKELFDFFDWNKTDKLTHIKMIPVFKLDEKDLKKFISHDIQIKKQDLKNISAQAKIWDKNDKSKNFALFCDDNHIIGIEFNEEGKSIKKSFLIINEELEILENSYKFKKKNMKYKVLKKTKFLLKTRKEIEEKHFITTEINNMERKKLEYVFFECFGKHETNTKLIIDKLLKLSKNSKIYKNLYNILKLTSTPQK